MGNTPFYKLGYLEVNQDLSQNIDLDELRFKTIDTQLYSLYQIFINGISMDSITKIHHIANIRMISGSSV
jgi:hypothetical protein